MMPLFFHVDIDAFFSSVEQLDNPLYLNKPVIVGGMGRRGVVSTCSYEARQFGVHSAMPTAQARQLCPNGIFLDTRMNRYQEKSKEVMKLFFQFSPVVQQISIDEAFLDMSGTEKILGSAQESAMQLKKTIKDKTGLTISIGAATSKYIAKIASGKSKPDGLLVIENGNEQSFIKSLSLKELWGIGPVMRKKLIAAGLNSVPKIILAEKHYLQKILGTASGIFLFNIVRANCDNVFNEKAKSYSLSTERTFQYDIKNIDQILDALFEMASEIMHTIIKQNITVKTVSIKIRYANFKTVSAQNTAKKINDTKDLYSRAKNLFLKKYIKNNGIRLIGIGVTKSQSDTESYQLELVKDKSKEKKRKMEESVFLLEKKAGEPQLIRARLLKKQ